MTLRETIIKAFSATSQPPADRISAPTYDDEGTAAYFAGKSWQGHSAKELRCYSSSLSFFTAEAFRYYLPAYMLAELDEPEIADVITEGILFHFTHELPGRELASCLTHEEREAVACFFDECARRYGMGYDEAATMLRRLEP